MMMEWQNKKKRRKCKKKKRQEEEEVQEKEEEILSFQYLKDSHVQLPLAKDMVLCTMCSFAKATIAKNHRLGGFEEQKLLFYSSRG